MKDIIKALIYSAPFALVVLYFSLQSKEEVKSEQRIRESTHAIESQKFDNDFADAFNNSPTPGAGAQIEKKQRTEQLADLQKKADQARAKRDQLDQMFDESTSQMKQSMDDAHPAAGAPSSVKQLNVVGSGSFDLGTKK